MFCALLGQDIRLAFTGHWSSGIISLRNLISITVFAFIAPSIVPCGAQKNLPTRDSYCKLHLVLKELQFQFFSAHTRQLAVYIMLLKGF